MTLDFLVRLNGRRLEDFDCDLISSPTYDFAGTERPSYSRPAVLGEGREPTPFGRRRTQSFAVALKPDVQIEERREKIDALLAWLDGLVEIRIGTEPDRIVWGELEEAPIRARWEAVGMIAGPVTFDLSFVVADGVAIGDRLRSLGLDADTSADILNLGTAPSVPLVVIPGDVDDPEIEVLGHDGRRISRLRLDGNVPDDAWWEIDSSLQRIALSASNGDRSDVSSEVYRDGDFPVFERRFGAALIPPRVKCTENALVYYRELWL